MRASSFRDFVTDFQIERGRSELRPQAFELYGHFRACWYLTGSDLGACLSNRVGERICY